MLIINNRFLSVYDYNFLLYYEKIFSVKQPKDQRFKVTEINQENDGVTNEMIWSLMKVQTKKSVITIK